MRYKTFSMQILAGPGEGFRVLAASTAGEIEAPLELALSADAVRSWEDGTGNAELTDTDVGRMLFRALFAGAASEVGRLYERSLGALGAGEGLRLVVRVNPHDTATAPWAQLPWELLYDATPGRFLALDRRTPVVRSLDVPHRKTGFQDEPPLRVLAATADPLDDLDLSAEVRDLLDLVAVGDPGGERLVFDVLEDADRRSLRLRLLTAENAGEPYHVLHLMAHGLGDGAQGQVFLEGPDGLISGPELVHILQDLPHLRLVYLGICDGARVPAGARHVFAGLAQALLRGGVTAVVAMRHEIADGAARRLSRTFYRRLADGESLEAALAEARLSLDGLSRPGNGSRSVHWATPVLFTRLEPLDDEPLEALAMDRRRWVWAAALAVLLGLGLGFLAREAGRRAEAADLRDEAVALLTAGRPAEAAETLALSLAFFAGDAAAHGNLASALLDLGRVADAESHLRRAVELAPMASVHAYNLARYLLDHPPEGEDGDGPLLSALEQLDRAVDLDPGFAAAANERIGVLLDLGRVAEARRAVRAALGQLGAENPEAAPLHRRRAWIAMEEGRYDGIREAMGEALRLDGGRDPWLPQEAAYLTARAEAAAGRLGVACAGLQEFYRLDPWGLSPWRGRVDALGIASNCTNSEG